MILPFPERISVLHGVLFGFLLSVGLVASGTGVIFSALAFVFVVVATIAFNVGGGMTRPSGSYVFFFSIGAVLIGLCMKVVLWEPTEMFLLSPLTTMSMYTGGIVAMLGAVYLARRFSRKEGFLQDVCSTANMRLAAIGCVVGGVIVPMVADLILIANPDSFVAPIATASRQVDKFLPMALILGVTYQIKSSGGKRSMNLWSYIAAFVMMFNGFFLDFSKEGLFASPVSWVIAAAALRFRFRVKHIVALVLFIAVSLLYLVPFCQYGRIFRDSDKTKAEQIEVSWSLITNLGEVREKNLESDLSVDRENSIFSFYSKPMGLFDRLVMIEIDDKLVTATDQKGPYGLSPIWFYVASIVPKFIWKGKPFIIMGNTFAHDIGFAEDDMTTGISFSPVVEGYHEAKWFGVFVICPLVWLAAFIITDSLCGDVRKSPWGLLIIGMFANVAPEGLLQGPFYIMTYGIFGVTVVAFAAAYVMPMLAHFVSPPRKQINPMRVMTPPARPAFADARPQPTEG